MKKSPSNLSVIYCPNARSGKRTLSFLPNGFHTHMYAMQRPQKRTFFRSAIRTLKEYAIFISMIIAVVIYMTLITLLGVVVASVFLGLYGITCIVHLAKSFGKKG